MELIIDNREKEIVKHYKDISSNFTISYDNLDLGDMIYKLDGKILVIIERKTVEDLSKSLKDGRYKEQKKRLKEAIHPKIRKILLIEGINNGIMKESTWKGVQINTMIRDNIQVIYMNSLQNTIQFLEDINKRIKKYGKDILNNIENSQDIDKNSYGKVCKMNKKSNITQEVFQINQYQQIPGVSYNLAKIIFENFGSMKNIYQNYINEEQIKDLNKKISEIKFGKIKRRIGNKLSDKIIRFLYN